MSRNTTLIQTPRLSLSLLRGDDAEDVFRYASNRTVAENTSWLPHQSIEDATDYVDWVVGAHSTDPTSLRHVWAIRLIDDPRVIGTIDLVVRETTIAAVDFALAQEFWGTGYVPEAAKATIAWGFSHLPGLMEIRSGCLSRNRGSVRVFEKLGFTHSATNCVPRPPKFPEPIEGMQFVLDRPRVLRDTPSDQL